LLYTILLKLADFLVKMKLINSLQLAQRYAVMHARKSDFEETASFPDISLYLSCIKIKLLLVY